MQSAALSRRLHRYSLVGLCARRVSAEHCLGPSQAPRQGSRAKYKMQHAPWTVARGLGRGVQQQRAHRQRGAQVCYAEYFAAGIAQRLGVPGRQHTQLVRGGHHTQRAIFTLARVQVQAHRQQLLQQAGGAARKARSAFQTSLAARDTPPAQRLECSGPGAVERANCALVFSRSRCTAPRQPMWVEGSQSQAFPAAVLPGPCTRSTSAGCAGRQSWGAWGVAVPQREVLVNLRC